MIQRSMLFSLLVGVSFFGLLGCGQSAPKTNAPAATTDAKATEADAEVVAALAELPEEDRKAAQAQKFCPVMTKNLLGSMGKPFKVTIEGQSVFLCCDGCKDDAVKNAQATLANVERLKRANTGN
jgi:hypothetical protein